MPRSLFVLYVADQNRSRNFYHDLLGDTLPDPASARGIPRAELYLVVDDASEYLQRALAAGARELSPLLARNWGELAAYCQDPDGHVLAFAQPS